MAWMEGFHVYGLHPRLVRILPGVHKTFEKGCHPSMTTSNMYYNPHLHINGLVVLQILSNLGPQLGRYVAWTGLDIGHLCVWITPYACQTLLMLTRDMWTMFINLSMATNPRNITHTGWECLVVCKYWNTLNHNFGGLQPV